MSIFNKIELKSNFSLKILEFILIFYKQFILVLSFNEFNISVRFSIIGGGGTSSGNPFQYSKIVVDLNMF